MSRVRSGKDTIMKGHFELLLDLRAANYSVTDEPHSIPSTVVLTKSFSVFIYLSAYPHNKLLSTVVI